MREEGREGGREGRRDLAVQGVAGGLYGVDAIEGERERGREREGEREREGGRDLAVRGVAGSLYGVDAVEGAVLELVHLHEVGLKIIYNY
jgi:hypothetical protein